MSLWPSRGLELHGFEVKTSRADWVKELADPAKAEEICRFCDRWWVVAGNAEIVRPGELPPTWGLLVLGGDKLGLKVEAPKLEALPADRLFLAALLRRAQETSADEEFLRAETEKRVKAREAELRAIFELRHQADARRHEGLRERVRAFEAASGVKIDGWQDAGAIGAAVAFVLSDEHRVLRAQLEGLRGQAARILASLELELGPDVAARGAGP